MRRVLKWVLVLDVIAVVIVAGWLLFGWKTVAGDTVTRKFYRTWGVYTRTAIDHSNDGSWNAIVYYRRDAPANEPTSQPYRFKEDRDRDGEFDLWVETESTPEGLTYRWEVDTDNDGQPDWDFLEAKYSVAYETIQQKRGF